MRRMLVVDDEPEMETLFRQCFRREIRAGDVDLVFAGSCEQALGVLSGDAGGDDRGVVLVFTDINMPGMNGFELLERIRDDDASLPVYLVTAYDTREYQERAARLGATGYLTKPVDLDEIKQVALTT